MQAAKWEIPGEFLMKSKKIPLCEVVRVQVHGEIEAALRSPLPNTPPLPSDAN